MNNLKTALVTVVSLLPLTLGAQGRITFSNISGSINAPVTFAETGELLGSGWWAQLWANAPGNELIPVSDPIEFTGNGYFIGGVVEVGGVPSGESGNFQVVAWQGPAQSLSEAQSSGLPSGRSNLFSTTTAPESQPGTPPSPPPNLEGLEAFSVASSDAPIISGRVWSDLNRNGIQDAAEPGIGDTEIRFLDCATSENLATVISQADGTYEFPGDIPNASYLEISVPTGFMVTAWQIGDDANADNDLDPLTARSQCIAIECEGEDTLCPGSNIDIGLLPIPSAPPIPDGTPTLPGEEPTTPSEDPNSPAVVLTSVGVSGPGYWKRQTAAWPVEQIEIGGIVYPKEQAVPLISNGSDKSLTMFRQVITAKLNIAAGNDGSCITEVLAEADQWLATHGPVPAKIRANNNAWKEGESLAKQLAEFNDGNACSPAQDESLAPVELAVGFQENPEPGRPQNFRVRVKGQAGRQFVLQKTNDFNTWEDVIVIDNAFGISEAIAEATAANPNAFFRVIPQRGPAKKPKPKKNKVGVFREVGANQNVMLEPIVYEGDLVIAGARNTITGQTLGPDHYTVIAGNLEVRGANNHVSNLTVLGDVILRGNRNELENVDYQGDLIQTGGPQNNVF